jgi:hypothetical protein
MSYSETKEEERSCTRRMNLSLSGQLFFGTMSGCRTEKKEEPLCSTLLSVGKKHSSHVGHCDHNYLPLTCCCCCRMSLQREITIPVV